LAEASRRTFIGSQGTKLLLSDTEDEIMKFNIVGGAKDKNSPIEKYFVNGVMTGYAQNRNSLSK
jgi:hypothetical protein